jgi:LEA14-like dessication related protein
MKKVFLLLGLGGVAYGVYTYYIQQFEVLANYDYRIVGGRLVNAGLKEVTIQVDVEVTNDSSISVVITDYYFDIFLNGVKVAVVKNASVNQRLEANGGKSFLPMLITISTLQFLKGDVVMGLVDSVKNSTITQKGYFGIKKGIIKYRNIPFDYTYRLKDFM